MRSPTGGSSESGQCAEPSTSSNPGRTSLHIQLFDDLRRCSRNTLLREANRVARLLHKDLLA